MKINKACDLSSISVLPPQSRRRPGVCSLPEMSTTFRQSQSSSQQQRSTQSFSQGNSSQPNPIFSQFSQNSQDMALTNDQLMASEERENSVKRFSRPPPVKHTQEESQMPVPRSSTGLMRKWGPVSDQRSQMSEESEHKIGMMESSLSRFGLMLESIQTDVMQINKGCKELTMDMETIHQKLHAHGNSVQTVDNSVQTVDNSVHTVDNSVQKIANSLQIINKGQEDVKSTIHGELKSLSEKLDQDKSHQISQEISVLLSGLEEKIGMFMVKLHNDLSTSFTTEFQAMVCKLKALEQKIPSPTLLPPKVQQKLPSPALLPPKAVSFCANPVGIPQKNSTVSQKAQMGSQTPKVEMGTWKSVKREAIKDLSKSHKHSRVSQTQLEREWSVVIESDEDCDRDFTFLSANERGNYLMEKAKEETERILRKARRRKRKQSNTIFIN